MRNGRGSRYVELAGLEKLETPEGHSLHEELGLARALLGTACDKMHQIQNGDFEDDTRISLMAKCMAVLMPLVDQVRRLAETDAKVQLNTGNMFSKDSAKLIIITVIEILEDELGVDVAERIIHRLKGSLPIAGDTEFLARRRVEVVYPEGDDSAELSPDPYLPSLPSSQGHLAGEIPGFAGRPETGKDALAGGKNGKSVSKKKKA